MVTTGDVVKEILKDAIDQVSDGGKMIFSMRSLFYAVRQLFLTRFFVCPSCEGEVRLKEPPDTFECKACGWAGFGDNLKPKYPGLGFYKQYNSFTQDFLRAYEKEHGKIRGMWREERGEYTCPRMWGDSTTQKVGGREETKFYAGVGNKVILVEKAGIYGILVENKFDRRLDGVILSTEGFSIEKARELLEEAEKEVKISVLHDYDINGLLIKETLTKPTKRLDISVSEVVDIGLNWEIVNKLMREQGLIPEPVELKLGDVAKLEGMLERGEVSPEEYRFLLGRTTELYDAWKQGKKVSAKEVVARGFRVEIQALRPSELIKWLEERLEELDLWKTVPEQEELDEAMEDKMKDELEDTKRELVTELKDEIEEKLGIDKLMTTLGKLLDTIENKLDEEISSRMEDLEFPTKDLDEFREEMRENMEKYWKILAEDIAEDMSEDLKDPFKEKVDEDEDEIITEGAEHEDVKEKRKAFAEEVRAWLQEQA